MLMFIGDTALVCFRRRSSVEIGACDSSYCNKAEGALGVLGSAD